LRHKAESGYRDSDPGIKTESSVHISLGGSYNCEPAGGEGR